MMNRRESLIGLSTTAVLAMFGPRSATGQAGAPRWPTALVRIVVPFTVGAVNDTLARLRAKDFQKRLGQNAMVENKAGGGTVIGTQDGAKSAPDGHTLLLVAFRSRCYRSTPP